MPKMAGQQDRMDMSPGQVCEVVTSPGMPAVLFKPLVFGVFFPLQLTLRPTDTLR